MVATVVVTGEGSNLKSGYRVRELSLFFVKTQQVRHYFFDPEPGMAMSTDEKQTDSYIRRKLGGIGVETVIPGALPYHELNIIITALGGYRILCAGEIAKKWLHTILPFAHIIDVLALTGFVYPQELIAANCTFKHSNPRYCSFSKLWTLVHYLRVHGEI